MASPSRSRMVHIDSDVFGREEGSTVFSTSDLQPSPTFSDESKKLKRVSLTYDGASTASERTGATTDSSDDEDLENFPGPDDEASTQPPSETPLGASLTNNRRNPLSPIGATSPSRSIMTLSNPATSINTFPASEIRPRVVKKSSKKVVLAKVQSFNNRPKKKVVLNVGEETPRTPEAGTLDLVSSPTLNVLSNLQEAMNNEITAYTPKYLQNGKDLETKLKEQSMGKNVDLVGDEVWAQHHRWYQNPGFASPGWHPAEAKPGALINQSKSLKLERLKTPADKRRIESCSAVANKNAEQIRESTTEIAQTPFRNLMFFDSRKKGREEQGSRRGARRANTTLSYYPPMNVDQLSSTTPVHYKVPKALLSPDDATRLGVKLGTTRIRLPEANSSLNNTTAGSGKNTSALLNTTASKNTGPMKFALNTMNDGTILPADVYKGPSQLHQKGRHHKCVHNCHICDEVSKDINFFECVEESREADRQAERDAERAQKEREEASEQQPDNARRNSKLRRSGDASARNKPASTGATGVVVKALDKLRKRVKPQTQMEKEPLDRHVTIAHLYFDMSHRDREDVYISVVGGLSFDLTRTKFSSLMGHVLAPRIGVNLTDEQIHTMFSLFDINHGGTISYFEYLTALCHTLMSERQTGFLTGVFNVLIAARQQAALQRQIASGKSVVPPSQLASLKTPLPSASTTGLQRSPSHAKGPMLHSSIPRAGSALLKKASLTAGSFRRHTKVGLPLDEDVEGSLNNKEGVPLSPRNKSKTFKGRPPSRGVDDDETSPARAKRDGAKQQSGDNPKPPAPESMPETHDTLGAGGARILSLRKKHLQYEKVRHTVFAYQGHSLMFPHPVEDRFSHLLADCFEDLKDTDELDLSKFKLLLFCDDAVMEVLNEIFPKPTPHGLGHLVEGRQQQ